jgi:hypothetical protein
VETRHILNIGHNSLGGGDSIDITAKKDGTGWAIQIEGSSSYDYVIPRDKTQHLIVETLEKFIDGIEIKDEPSFVGGLVFGFLNANWPPDRKLDPRQRKEAAEFVEVESDDFPQLAENYRSRIADWAANHS